MERRTEGRGPSRGLLAALAAGGALVWLVGRRRGGRGRGRAPASPSGLEFGPAPFPPVKQGAQWERLRTLARKAEDVSKIDGLASYLLATAKGESLSLIHI